MRIINKIFSLLSEKTKYDNFFESVYKLCFPYTMTSKEAMYSLYSSTKYIEEAKIPGDFVECGVWKGGNIMLIAKVLNNLKIYDKKIFLYDTFRGMPKPSKIDLKIKDLSSAYDKWKKNQNKKYNSWCYAPLQVVKKNVFSVGYPKKNFIFVKGKIENTIPKIIPNKIAILRLDTDFYSSIKHGLIHLFPRLSKGGVLIIDDYEYWSGAKKAVDEYIKQNKIPILLIRIDSTVRLGIKIND